MAQFDVHELARSDALVVDCQTDLLDHLDSRFVVPLVALDRLPNAAKRLNPVFEIAGVDHVMLTQAASAVMARDLGTPVDSLADHALAITGALDFLITGV